MWGDVLLSIVLMIGESVFSNHLKNNELKKFQKQLNSICQKKFNDFADSSLDCGEFYNFIKSEKFKIILRSYYYTIVDLRPKNDYFSYFISVIKISCPSSKHTDIENFLKQVDEVYSQELYKIISNNAELSALLAILTTSNRTLIRKITESEDNLKRYINSCSEEKEKFDDKTIDVYHKACEDEFSIIYFSGIAGAEMKEPRTLNELYVENTFQLYSKRNITEYDKDDECLESSKTIRFGNFFDYNNKIVILGGAGFGKSTSLNFLFCNYEKIYSKAAIKLKINLKDYASSISSKEVDILDCFSKEFSKRVSNHRLKKYDVKATLSRYLDEGKCLVIFDALDEIVSQAMRDNTRTEVATFCNVYYLNRYIITSREIGYLRNNFDESFLHLRINMFFEDQIKEYAKKWFDLNSTGTVFSQFIEKFMFEIQKSKCLKLIQNPIILVLALFIFDVEHNLPHRKTEFYKKCIETFLISREERKEAFDISDKMRNILGDDLIIPKVAFYKFNKLCTDANYKFDYDELKESIMQGIEVLDRRNWIDAVNKFSYYLVNRTELIREKDDNEYDFSHKTFSEYFLAVYFAKDLENKELIERLDNWIGDANYDELARLIIEVVIEKNNSAQHKLLINHLFTQVKNNADGLSDLTSRHLYMNSLEKMSNYTLIISDLYKNNLIQPKFLEQYHTYLIDYPEIQMTRRNFISRSVIGYDPNAFIDIFNEKLHNNQLSVNHSIKVMFNFSKQFYRKASLLLNDDFCIQTLQFFCLTNRLQQSNFDEIFFDKYLNYLNLYWEKVKKSAEIFMLTLKILLCNTEKFNNTKFVTILLKFSFEPTIIFKEIIPGKLYRELILVSFTSPEALLITLISIVKCNAFSSVRLLRQTISSTHSFMDDEEVNILVLQENARKIIFLFDNCETKENFIDNVVLEGMYNEQYFDIYDDLIDSHLKYEDKY